MNIELNHLISQFYLNIKNAGSELAKKELFKTLLVRLFDKDPILASIINEIDTGAEKTIFNIPLEHRRKTGSADTQYRNVIIEFERDLKKTEEHAKEQLTEYLSGNWLSGNNYEFILIATDCISWKVYYPDYEKLIDNDIITTSDVKLEEKDAFVLTEKNGENFFFFIDHYLFRTQAQRPTFQSIKKDFGDSSSTFLFSIRELASYFRKIKDDSEITLVYEQWHLFLSIAYGSFKGSIEVFLIHTYLSIFSKILAYAVISRHRFITDEEMKEILNGEIFNKLNVNNFIESDFFHWISKEEHFSNLKRVFRRISTQLSDYDFTRVDEDVLKGIYQELIDIETRHALGEYYTPDWLAERIVAELPLKKDSMVLDPACGSGSFLRAVISKLKKDYPDISLQYILSQVIGIDIHPLSVQIAKTTILLAVADRLKKVRKPINLQVYLANTLLIPDDSLSLFSEYFDVHINKKKYKITNQLIKEPSFFDQAIGFCEELAKLDIKSNPVDENQFQYSLKSRFKSQDISEKVNQSLYIIYQALKQAIDAKENSIWGFILQNSYKPFFLRDQFDFVVGNPPWLPYRAMNNESYQNQLLELADKYKLVPKYESITHLELAAIFLSHCAHNFLKKDGAIAFVLPRGFISADHHANTRNGSAQGFRIKQIWDLIDVSPLFRITSCVFIAKKHFVDYQKPIATYQPGEIKGYILSGNLPSHHVNWTEAESFVEMKKADWFYVQLGKRSAFSTEQSEYSTKSNHYINLFKQGATLVPRNLYFIELQQDEPEDYSNRTLVVQTDQEIKKGSKKPWDSISFSMQINSQFLFRTALSKNVLPFALVNPTLVHLPIEINEDHYPVLLHWQTIRNKGLLESSKWFKDVETMWEKYKTEKSKEITYLDWLNWQNKLTSQNLFNPYLVLYTASSKDANAAIVGRQKINLPFIIESKTYWFSTTNRDEAVYLTTFLNSNFANKAIKDFQSTGLFGHRDVHKKILELPLPQFDKENKIHLQLAKLGQICEKKTDEIIKAFPHKEKISGIKLGTARKVIREKLKEELIIIDGLLKKII